MFVEEYLVDLRREGYTPAAWRRYVDRSFRLAREAAWHVLAIDPAEGVVGDDRLQPA